jgi:hypothetical protein
MLAGTQSGASVARLNGGVEIREYLPPGVAGRFSRVEASHSLPNLAALSSQPESARRQENPRIFATPIGAAVLGGSFCLFTLVAWLDSL